MSYMCLDIAMTDDEMKARDSTQSNVPAFAKSHFITCLKLKQHRCKTICVFI